MNSQKSITLVVPTEIREIVNELTMQQSVSRLDESCVLQFKPEDYGVEAVGYTRAAYSEVAHTLLPILERLTEHLRRDPDADSWHMDILHDDEAVITYREDDPQNDSLEEGWNWGS